MILIGGLTRLKSLGIPIDRYIMSCAFVSSSCSCCSCYILLIFSQEVEIEIERKGKVSEQTSYQLMGLIIWSGWLIDLLILIEMLIQNVKDQVSDTGWYRK